VSSAAVTIEGHWAASAPQGFLQVVDVGLRLELVVPGKVTEVGCPRVAVVAAPGPVKDNDGTDVFRIGSGEVQRIVGTQRKADHRKAAAGIPGTIVEKHGCIGDVGLGSQRVGVESRAKGLRIGDVVRDLAMIEVGGERHETGFSKLRAETFHGVVQSPPGMKDQYSGPRARGRDGEKALRSRRSSSHSTPP